MRCVRVVVLSAIWLLSLQGAASLAPPIPTMCAPLAAPAAQASAGFLQQELSRLSAAPEARGLSFCALFARVVPPWTPPDVRAVVDSTYPIGHPLAVAIGADLPLIPASVAKLATTALALERLGPAFRFRTRLLAAAPVAGGVLNGDLVVQGGGDPFLVSERLWLLANQLREIGLRRVRGGLVLDDSRFAPPDLDPIRTQERETSDRPYGSRLSPLAVNFNAAAVRVAPGEKPGDPALVESDPLSCSYIRIANRLTTGTRDAKEEWTVRLLPDSSGETAQVEGVILAGAAPQTAYRSVRDPDRFAASLLRAFLLQAGITIDGPSRSGVAPPGAAPLLEFPSLPLGNLLQLMNQNSNNLMADLIAMAIGAADIPEGSGVQTGPKPAGSGTNPARTAIKPADQGAEAALNLTRGGQAITRWLRSRFHAGDEVRQLDGSGLNPSDRLTGSVLQRLLCQTWRDLRIQPDFAASLALPHNEGTLRTRFAREAGIVLRAKSGTLSDSLASGLAGYLKDRATSQTVAFVILMNAAPGSGWTIPKLQELQESWIAQYLN